MIIELNKYSFYGIQDLCKIHYSEIMERRNLKSVLESRKVRFIDPMGKYGYADFGEFYFNGDVMMLVTRDEKYTQFHVPDQLANTLWSTIPVIYAGIDTRFRDDRKQSIFTGDVVTYKNTTSMVRYYGSNEIPGLAGDNCETLFDGKEAIHKEGTVFSNISRELFQWFDYESLQWPLGQFVQKGLTQENVIERARFSVDEPLFIETFPKIKPWKRAVYEDLNDFLKKDDLLVYFVSEPYHIPIADYIPEDFKGKGVEIPLPKGELKIWKETMHDFLLTAHNNPEKRYVFCDFKDSLNIKRNMQHEFAMTFYEWYEYNIPNVAFPLWVYFCHGAHDGIGRD